MSNPPKSLNTNPQFPQLRLNILFLLLSLLLGLQFPQRLIPCQYGFLSLQPCLFPLPLQLLHVRVIPSLCLRNYLRLLSLFFYEGSSIAKDLCMGLDGFVPALFGVLCSDTVRI